MNKIITSTGDGSPTLYVPEINEHYHSIYGAVQESTFVYIDNALNKINKKNIRLFEVGFGTGLNAMLTCLEAERQKRFISYYSIEKFPLESSIWHELEKYFRKSPAISKIYRLVNDCLWEGGVQLTKYFMLHKIKSDFTTYYPAMKYDVIYFDAFSPEVQPELWTPEIFLKIADMMDHGAVLSTYSAKGQVRRNIISAGMRTVRIAGPPGKREMIMAFKPHKGEDGKKNVNLSGFY
jgi:tRNA U34 5-methylaminomethyl-2-thiouridine-forming methyltransferase MnmC